MYERCVIHFLAVNETLDSILDESGDEEEQETVVNQVLDEIGIEISGRVSVERGSFVKCVKLHTDDVSLPRTWQCFCLAVLWGSTNQGHYPDLGSDTSSVWNFCACFPDAISRGN